MLQFQPPQPSCGWTPRTLFPVLFVYAPNCRPLTVMLNVSTGCTTAFVEKKRTVSADGATDETSPFASFQLDAAFMSGERFAQTSMSQADAGAARPRRRTTTRGNFFMRNTFWCVIR